MNKRIMASFLSLALLSSNVLLAQTDPTDVTAQFPTNEPATFLDQVKFYLAAAAFGVAFSFKHKFSENSIAGNDRIIFATYYKRDEAYDEGYKLGGSVLGAIAQCEAAKHLYEKHYEPGICDRIKEYAPKSHDFERAVWDATFWYVLTPAAVLGSIALGVTTFCVHKKLKQS